MDNIKKSIVEDVIPGKIYKIWFITEDGIKGSKQPGANTMHSEILVDYINECCNEDPVLSKLTLQTGANSLAYALSHFKKMAIILNETRIGANGLPKYGTFAGMILPDYITPKLKENILSLSESLKDFTSFYVEKTIISVIDNQPYLDAEIIPVDNSLSILDKLNNIIDEVNKEDIPKR